ncbi:MAG: exonuclease domain-containing protein [Chloroflexi bacterium]|nr:MAG: sporulation inhibitor KapD [Chloroflexi bacterium OLB13]MBC6957241.1 DNA polymerase III [Chloroflexota bacterium]MBV6437072.1 hypothetical protein [Anaerolineae bacterium]MDL1916543.1 exonuclease domain-containing protein [Anaerolineae bacterium CFX4]OQY76641.1 MAG: hypothetical protein B6D42_16955 [Anaerolineae bacterium UTCFX5]
MTLLLDQLVIVDLEATCWRGPPPDGQRVEIIEIGVSALDLTSFEITARESVLVKPVSSEVSAFCTELTHITPEMTAGGVGLAEACAWLRDRFCSAGRMWGSWGSFDRKLFEAQCAADCVPYPFGAHHANLKRVYARLTKRKQGVGLRSALEHLELPFDGTHHRGGDDAYNTARIVQLLCQTYGIASLFLTLPKKDRPVL